MGSLPPPMLLHTLSADVSSYQARMPRAFSDAPGEPNTPPRPHYTGHTGGSGSQECGGGTPDCATTC